MASRRYMLLAAILITIYLDISSVVVVAAAAIAWDPRTSSRYDSYNLDRGPVFYEAYFPDIHDAYQEKRYFDRSAVLETSFQVPFKRLTYSAEIADHPVSSNESLIMVGNEKTLPREQWEAIEFRRNYNAANKFAPFHNVRSTIFDDDKNLQAANIEEISKLVRRAISRDLQNWNTFERYLDRTSQSRPISGYSKENRENREDYTFQVNRRSFDSSKQPSFEILRKLEADDAKRQSIYFEEVDASKNTMTNKKSVSDMQVADASLPIDVIPDSLSPENIFQPRPQLIRYTFFKKPSRVYERTKEAIDASTPRNYGDNLIREQTADSNRGKRAEGNIKVTSIEVSELPRHKTRHHHGEWPKRDYSTHHHRSQSAAHPIV